MFWSKNLVKMSLWSTLSLKKLQLVPFFFTRIRMRLKNDHQNKLFLRVVVGVIICIFLLLIWRVATLTVSQTKRLEKLEKSTTELSELLKSEMEKRQNWKEISEKDPLKIYEEENAILKQRSLEYSPDGQKFTYYQHKFISDLKKTGDSDYTSLIVEQDGKKKVVFQTTFGPTYFDWLNNSEIKVYKGCGSSCLLSYVVNIYTKKYTESVEQIPPENN